MKPFNKDYVGYTGKLREDKLHQLVSAVSKQEKRIYQNIKK